MPTILVFVPSKRAYTLLSLMPSEYQRDNVPLTLHAYANLPAQVCIFISWVMSLSWHRRLMRSFYLTAYPINHADEIIRSNQLCLLK